MKTLKVPLALLLVYLAIVFNIEVLTLNANYVLNLHRFVDFLILFIVISSLLVHPFHKLPAYAQLSYWIIIYFGLWVFSNKSTNVQINVLVMLVEIAMVALASLLSWVVATRFFEFEDTLARLVFASFQGRALSMDEAAEGIEIEVQRSRRYQRALSVVVVEPDPATIRKVMVTTVEEIQNNLARRYAMSQLSEAIGSAARKPDVLIRLDQSDRFVILCPEADADSTSALRHRIQAAVKSRLGVSISMGVASFPDDALTFEELMDKASAKLAPVTLSPLPAVRSDEAKSQNL